MSRTVMCKKLNQELKGLDAPPIPGEIGLEIYNNISEQAWKEWQSQQTMLINEKQLNMMNANDRTFLKEEMNKFFKNEDFEQAEGYVPPTK